MVKLRFKVANELQEILESKTRLEQQVNDNIAVLTNIIDKVSDDHDKRCKIVEAELKQIIVETGKLRQTAVANKMAVGKVQGVQK